MPRGETLAGGDGGPEWEILPDDVFVPRRGRGRVDLAAAMARRKRHRHSGDVFVPRRAPRTGPPADPDILVVSSRVRTPRRPSLSEPRAVESSPASWDGVWDAKSAAAAVRDHDGHDSDPTEVFAAHLASGWTLRPRRGVAGDGSAFSGFPADGEKKTGESSFGDSNPKRGARYLELCAPDHRRADDANGASALTARRGFGARSARASAEWTRIESNVLREAFGLEPMAPRDPKHEKTTRPIARAIAKLCGGISAARLGGVTCRERRWCRVGLDESFAALARVAACDVSHKKKKSENVSAVARRAAAAAGDLAAGVTRSLREAERALDEDEARLGRVSPRRLSESATEREDATDSIGSVPHDAFARAAAAMGAGATSGPAPSTLDHRDPTAYGKTLLQKSVGVDMRVTHRCAIALASALDEAWFQVAYHARACGWCDPSDAYGSGCESRAAGSGEETEETTEMSAAYFAAVETAAFPRLERVALVRKARADPNPFAAVLHSRLREGARLFARAREEEKELLFSRRFVVSDGDGVGERAVVAAAEKEKKRQKNEKAASRARERERTLPVPACPPLTRAWRDACRSWPCRLYAFAAPTDAAMRALRKSATRWLEVGAGAGYWAAQMRRSGMDVVAVDVDPPGEETHNDYHGSCATWHPVVRGDAAAARSAGEKTTSSGDAGVAGRALFMCYPPPGFDSRMASETLEAYGGGVLALVGEWDGNTADGAFASLLTKHFYLARRAALPQWGDTAHELTVWRRKRKKQTARGEGDATLPLKSCAWCGGGRVEGAAFSAKTPKRLDVLRRCVLCRDDRGTFCSASCASLGAAKHAETHELRLIPTPIERLKDWSDRGDYVAFRPFAR